MFRLSIMFFVALALWCVVMNFHVHAQGSADQTSPASDLIPSHLLEAVINHDIDAIGASLEHGENIDLTNDRGWSAARFAVTLGDLDILRELIDRGIDLNQPDIDGVTPLIAAASAGDKEVVEVLLAGNANPLQKAHDSNDAYHAAIQAGRQLVALMIVESAALHAIEQENIEDLMTSLSRGAYVNIRNGAGWTPMMFAVTRGDVDVVKSILKFGPDLNRTENDGWTALHFAASQGSVEIVKLLLENNADPFIQNVAGKTARELAAQENHQEVVELLPAHEGL